MTVPSTNLDRSQSVTLANPTPPTNVAVTYQGTPPTPVGLAPAPTQPLADAGLFADPLNGAVATQWTGTDALPVTAELAGKAEADGTEVTTVVGNTTGHSVLGDYTETPNASHPSSGGESPAAPDSAAFTNFIERTTDIDASHRTAYKNLLDGLTEDGFFDASGDSILDGLWIIAAQDDPTFRINLVADRNPIENNIAGWTFTADQGVTGGSGSLFHVMLNSSTAGLNTTPSSQSFGAWDGASGSGAGDHIFGTDTVTQAIFPSFTGTTTYYRIQGDITADNTVALGFYAANRDGTTTKGYKNGVEAVTGTSAVGSILNGPWTFGTSPDLVRALFVGGSLTATQHANLYARLAAYMEEIDGGGGAGVTKNIVSDYGAVGDAQWEQTTLSITTNILTSATPIWPGVAGDYVGKAIYVGMAGGYAPQGGVSLVTTITGWTSATQITLADNALNPLSSEPNVIVAWGTNSYDAFLDFRTDNQGGTVTLTIPPGKYLIAPNLDLFDGIRDVTFNGTGATLCGDFRFLSSFQYQVHGHSGYTASVSAGATYVTLITPSDASKFVVGDYAMMSGFDMQMSGYPTNLARFEYLKIVAINAPLGRVTFETPLVNSYLSTWPIYTEEDTSGMGSQRFGGPATLYAMDPHFGVVSEVNGLTVVMNPQSGISGGHHTFNDCTFVSHYGPFPSVAWSVTFNNCTGTNCRMEIDKLVYEFSMTGCTWEHLGFQSASSNKLVVLDDTNITDGFVGSPEKIVIRNGCDISYWQTASVFFGFPIEVEASDSVIRSMTIHPAEIRSIEGGTTGGSGDGIQLDTTMVGNIIPVPAAKRKQGVSNWAITGNRLFFNDPQVGSVGLLTITDVRDSPTVSGGIDIHTDWPTGHFPARTYGSLGLWLVGHPAHICTFNNVTGCPEAVDLSGAPDGEPMWTYSKRTYDKSFVGSSTPWGVMGKIRKIRVNVDPAYTGSTGTVAISVFPGHAVAIGGDGSSINNTFGINLKVAGVRELDVTADSYPKNWTGAQSGDTLPTPGLASAMWACGNLRVDALHDISAETSALSFTVEMITDHGF